MEQAWMPARLDVAVEQRPRRRQRVAPMGPVPRNGEARPRRPERTVIAGGSYRGLRRPYRPKRNDHHCLPNSLFLSATLPAYGKATRTLLLFLTSAKHFFPRRNGIQHESYMHMYFFRDRDCTGVSSLSTEYAGSSPWAFLRTQKYRSRVLFCARR